MVERRRQRRRRTPDHGYTISHYIWLLYWLPWARWWSASRATGVGGIWRGTRSWTWRPWIWTETKTDWINQTCRPWTWTETTATDWINQTYIVFHMQIYLHMFFQPILICFLQQKKFLVPTHASVMQFKQWNKSYSLIDSLLKLPPNSVYRVMVCVLTAFYIYINHTTLSLLGHVTNTHTSWKYKTNCCHKIHLLCIETKHYNTIPQPCLHAFDFLCFQQSLISNGDNIWAATWENWIFAYGKTKTQISFTVTVKLIFAVTAKLISVFVFATRIVQSLYLLNPKFRASSHLLWLYSPVCVGPGREPRRSVFSRRGSY